MAWPLLAAAAAEPDAVAVFAFLRPPARRDYRDYVRSRRCVAEALPQFLAYDNVAFVLGSVPDGTAMELRGEIPRLRLINALGSQGEDEPKPGLQVTAATHIDRETSRMRHFRALRWLRALREYGYAMRVDEDVCIRRLSRSSLLAALGADHSISFETNEVRRRSTDTVRPLLLKYLAASWLSPFRKGGTYAFSVFITRMSWWEQPDVQDFLSHEDGSGVEDPDRFGGAFLLPPALRLVASNTLVTQLDFDAEPLANNGNDNDHDVAHVFGAVSNAEVRRAMTDATALNASGLCLDSAGAFESIALCSAGECKSGLDYLGPLLGGFVALCEMSVEEVSQKIDLRFLCTQPFTPPVPASTRIFELCPLTCSQAGLVIPSCDHPNPPGPPPLPWAQLPARTPDGAIIVHSVAQLRAVIINATSVGWLTVYLPPGTLLPLDGNPIFVDAIDLNITSDGDGAVIDAAHRSRVFVVQGGATLRLESITIANGHASTQGGAMLLWNASVTLRRSFVVNSSALASGGAVYLAGGRLVVEAGSLLSQSSASAHGGCILCIEATMRIDDSSAIRRSSAGAGGAVYGISSHIMVTNYSVVALSTSETVGGAFCLARCYLAVKGGSSISQSVALQAGGSYYSIGGQFELTEGSFIAGSSATVGGALAVGVNTRASVSSGSAILNARAETAGAIFVNGGIAVLSGRSAIRNCIASYTGGAIQMSAGTVRVIGRSLIFGSFAKLGGALSISGGDLLISDESMVASSSSTSYGGALSITGGSVCLFRGSSIINSSTSSIGGAVAISGGSLLISGGASISRSSASLFGGAMLSVGGSVVLKNGSSITHSLSGEGGALYVAGGEVRVEEKSTIDDSSAVVRGGAVYLESGSVHIVDSTVKDATGRHGSTFCVIGGTLRLTHALVEDTDLMAHGALLHLDSGGVGVEPLVVLTHTTFHMQHCDSVFSADAPAQLVLRNVSFVPMASCNTTLLASSAFHGITLSSTKTCGSSLDDAASGFEGLCADDATCLNQHVNGTPLIGVVCECSAPGVADPARGGWDAPYQTGQACLWPRVVKDMYTISREVSVSLSKPHLLERAINLTVVMQGDETGPPARWNVTNAAQLPGWLELPAVSGLLTGSSLPIELKLSIRGLHERTAPYTWLLLIHAGTGLPITGGQVHAVKISLNVQAELLYFVWGRVRPDSSCPPPTRSTQLEVRPTVNVELPVPFTECDMDMLPLSHQLSPDDPRQLHADLVAYGLTERVPVNAVAYSGQGVYLALLTVPTHGPFEFQIHFGQDTGTLVGMAECPFARVPMPSGRCGCQPGYYQMTEDTDCVPCFPATTSSAAGAVGPQSCDICIANHYRTSSSACDVCPPGAMCPYNSTLQTLQAQPGFWRLAPTTPKFYPCEAQRNISHILWSSCTGGASVCAEGHSGPLCKLCLSKNAHYQDGACRRCPERGVTVGLAIGIVAGGLAVIVLLLLLYRARPSRLEWISGPVHRLEHYTTSFVLGVGLIPKLKLLLVFAQVISTLDATYKTGMPGTWFEWTSMLNIMGQINWMDWVIPSACLVGSEVINQVYLRAIAPFVIICGLPVVGAICSVLAERASFRRPCCHAKGSHIELVKRACTWIPASLVLAFCFTPSVSSTIFRSWDCVSFAYNDLEYVSFLKVDLSVRCGDEQHANVTGISWVLVAIWPIGMVILYVLLLFPLRHTLRLDSPESPLLHATAFLHRDFKRAYFWWEIPSLIHRTILTGWLLLIDDETPLLRLLTAIIVSIAFLVALLVCRPYKRTFDGALAAGTHLMIVSIFLGSVLVLLYERIANDSAGSSELAYRFIGLHSSDEAVAIMIIITLSMTAALAAALAAETYTLRLQKHLQQKWSVGAMNPPSVKSWKWRGVYACFLSHYKMESGSDARYMHDLLRKMLRAPVFIDSIALSDMRKLMTDGLLQSDMVLLLATKGVLSRPWCLLELFEARKRRIPVVIVHLAHSPFSISAARQFVTNFEEEMRQINPSGLSKLREQLGSDLGELRTSLLSILDDNDRELLTFDSHVGDRLLVASMQDIVERMAEMIGLRVEWQEKSRRAPPMLLRRFRGLCWSRSRAPSSRSMSNRARPSQLNCVSRGLGSIWHKDHSPAVFVCFAHHEHVTSHVHVLHTAISMKLDRKCVLGGSLKSLGALKACELVVVVLSRHFLVDAVALFEAFVACARNMPIVTVAITGGGYDHEEAANVYANLPKALEDLDSSVVPELESMLPEGTSLAHVGEKLNHALTSIIAHSWSPLGSKHQLDAIVSNIVSKIPRRRALQKPHSPLSGASSVVSSQSPSPCSRAIAMCPTSSGSDLTTSNSPHPSRWTAPPSPEWRSRMTSLLLPEKKLSVHTESTGSLSLRNESGPGGSGLRLLPCTSCMSSDSQPSRSRSKGHSSSRSLHEAKSSQDHEVPREFQSSCNRRSPHYHGSSLDRGSCIGTPQEQVPATVLAPPLPQSKQDQTKEEGCVLPATQLSWVIKHSTRSRGFQMDV